MTIIFSVMLLIAAGTFFTMSLPHPNHFIGCNNIKEWVQRYWDHMRPDQELAAIVSVSVTILAVALIVLTLIS